ncbi:MAG: hypothetical protein A2Y23_03845 [Clostridiales bacterium GWB2_37_7]|nr:MAG: hypothetical protein A2Y23_03845 [Clostridiales bacterium GWB2_37_7]
MSKKVLNKILLIMFFVSIFFASYIELKNNLQQLKVEYKSERAKVTDATALQSGKYNEIIDMDTKNINIFKILMGQIEQKYSKGNWKSVERKDSYNNELQFYSKENVFIKDNIIEITSKKENKGNKLYTSGLVESTYAYKYGYFEFTIEISEGKGIFPAIWFLPNYDYEVLEIDLFEMIGSEPYTFYGVIHFVENGIQDSDYFKYKAPKKENYSVALEWNTEALTWYIDNQKIYTTTKGVPQEYMYIIINQAIGGDWPGDPDDSVFPNKFKVTATKLEPVFKKGRN